MSTVYRHLSFTHITHAKVCMSVLYDHIHFARVMTAPVVVTCL